MNKASIILLVFVLIACDDGIESPAKKVLKVYSEATISDEYPYVTSGGNMVLHYYYKSPNLENVADDGFSEDFFFELATFETEFDFDSSKPIPTIYSFNHLYRHYCYCAPTDSSHLNSFKISGKKNGSGNWMIEGDVGLELVEGWENETIENPYTWEKSLNLHGTYKSSSFPRD